MFTGQLLYLGSHKFVSKKGTLLQSFSFVEGRKTYDWIGVQISTELKPYMLVQVTFKLNTEDGNVKPFVVNVQPVETE